MSFLHPTFLYALVAIAIPIIIHLFDFRRTKKVYFSNTQLLHQVKESTKSFYNLKHILILLSRILFILFIVLAFAQPILTPDDDQGLTANKVGLFIDNSKSMSNTVAEDESGLDLAKELAHKMIELYPSGTEFIIQQSYEDKSAYLYLSKQEANQYIDKITFSSAYRPLKDILVNFHNTRESIPPKEVVLISDFQKSTLLKNQLANDTLTHMILLPVLFESYQNMVVDTAFISNPLELNKSKTNLVVEIKNFSQAEVSNIPVKIFMGDRQLSVTSVNVPADGQASLDFNIGFDYQSKQQGKIVIDDYPVSFDNELFFTLGEIGKVNVVQINEDESGQYLSAVFGNESLFNWQQMLISNLNYRHLAEADLIILNQISDMDLSLAGRLKALNNNGKSILIIPASKQSLPAYRILIPSLSKTNLEEAQVLLATPDFTRPFFAHILEKKQTSISMPKARSVWSWGNDRNALLKFIDGRPFLSEVVPNRYVLASPLSDQYSNFQVNALFVPIMYRIAASNKQNITPLFHRLSETEITLPIKELPPKSILKLVKDDLELIPDQRISGRKAIIAIPGQTMAPGHYNIESKDSTYQMLALNMDTEESDIAIANSSALAKVFAGKDYTIFSGSDSDEIITQITNEFKGIELWRYFLAIALLFLLIEVLLIRLL